MNARALALVQRIHAGMRGAVPAWHHMGRVATVLEAVLAESNEGTLDDREAIVVAALAHDALEDTPITRDELAATIGARALAIVEGMTSPLGDADHAPYIAQVAAAEEAVRLVKLSDLYDNVTSVTHQLFQLGVEWADGWFLSVTRPMFAAIRETRFATYPVASARLVAMVSVAMINLDAEIARYR